MVLLCNMNPCGLTLTLLRKRPRHAPYESPCLHHKNIVHLYDIFLCGIGDSHDFIVVLLCNMNPCGLTLTLLRKRPRHAPYESPCLHHKNIVHLYDIFLCGIGDSHDFIVVLLCNMNPCGLITNEERRKRVAFADIECSFIANKSDTKCPRKAQCNARFVERRRSEK